MSYEPLVEAQLADIASQIRHYVDDSIPSIEVRPGSYVYRMWLMIDSSLTCTQIVSVRQVQEVLTQFRTLVRYIHWIYCVLGYLMEKCV